MNCVIYANCQGFGLSRYLLKLGFSAVKPLCFENYRTNAGTLAEKQMHEAVAKCDLLIVNVTSAEKWGTSSGEYVVSTVASKTAQVIRIPYVFNTGQVPLCRRDSVNDPRKDFFGEDEMRDYLKSRSMTQLLRDYLADRVPFYLREQFSTCLEEQRRREESCDVKLAEFMLAHQRERLMLTLNHPTSIVLLEAARQIVRLTGRHPRPVTILNENETNLPSTELLSRYVIREFGLRRAEDAGANSVYMKRLQEAYLRARAS